MTLHHRRLLSAACIFALLSLSACKQKAPATLAASAHPAPYKIYQGVGNIGEEKGGRVCFVYGKAEHCWNAGVEVSEVKAKPIKLPNGGRLLLVTALSMGGSDGTLDLVLLDEQNQQPVNLLPQVQLDSANAGQWEDLLSENLSPMPIIVKADPVWSDDNISNAEDRGRVHQFTITAYYYDKVTARYTGPVNYVTSRKYSDGEDVIALEKPNIMAMLKGAAIK
ncbi:MAG: hypothetical protein ACLQGT_06090 [Terracidiphilus sp.]